jgi:hypothetical protein
MDDFPCADQGEADGPASVCGDEVIDVNASQRSKVHCPFLLSPQNAQRKTLNAQTPTPSPPTLSTPTLNSNFQHRPIRVIVFHPVSEFL